MVVTINLATGEDRLYVDVHGDYDEPTSGDRITPPTHAMFSITDVFYEDVSVFNLMKCIDFDWERLEEKVLEKL